MSFDSWEFLLFFSISFLLFYLVPSIIRWMLLLGLNFVFLMWPDFLLTTVLAAIMASTFTWMITLVIGLISSRILARTLFWVCVTGNLFLLLGCKYILPQLQGISAVLVPIGISYFTLEHIRFCYDVYVGEARPIKNPMLFLCYTTFFPKFVAGPIVNSSSLVPQLVNPTSFNYYKVASGLRLFIWGVFKKKVIADHLSFTANTMYSTPYLCSKTQLIIGILAFSMELHFNFSAYTDMARGAAKMLGIELPQNFNNPFISTSLSEFWQRWHITVSTWFRDMVYKPVFLYTDRALKRISLPATQSLKISYVAGTFVTFSLLGWWHRLDIKFLVLGLSMASVLSFEMYFKIYMKRIKIFENTSWVKLLGVVYVIVLYCIFALILGAKDLHSVSAVFHSLLSKGRVHGVEIFDNYSIFMVPLVAGVFFLEFYVSVEKNRNRLLNMPWWVRYPSYLFLVFLILGLGNFIEGEEFIYKQY